jgi:hypothetical protein
MARAGLIRARLSRLEQDRRWLRGARRIMVMVPRSSYLESGTECDVHDGCRFAMYGPVEAHFLCTDPPGQQA